MTDRERDDHEFSEGQGFGDPYDPFDLDPPELSVDPDKVDPVDSRVVTDMLDERNLSKGEVDAEDLLDVGVSYVQINRYEQAAETFERAAMFADRPPSSRRPGPTTRARPTRRWRSGTRPSAPTARPSPSPTRRTPSATPSERARAP